MNTRKAAAVSMEHDLYERARERAKALGLPTFSAYVVQLILADLKERGDLILSEHAQTPPSTPQ